MDSIKAQKFQAMKTYKKAHKFVYNFVVYTLTAFLSSLFYLYMFCFPSMRQYFLFDFLPNIYSFLLTPKFLFLLGNTIVIILFLGESSSNAGSSSSSPATEIYDEYMEIRRRNNDLIRRRHVAVVDHDACKKKDCKNVINIEEMNSNDINKKNKEKMSTKTVIRKNCSLNDINKSIEERKKKKEMSMAMVMAGRGLRRPRSTVERSEKKKQNENPCIGNDNDNNNDNYRCNIDIRSPPNQEEEIVEEMSTSHGHGFTRPQSLGRLDMHENHKKEIINRRDIIMSREDKRKEIEKSMDELNRRVEDFIARVNRQRLIEAKELELELELNSSVEY